MIVYPAKVCALVNGMALKRQPVDREIGFEFQVVAAVVLGGISLSGGVGSLFGMALGVLILSFLSNGLGMLELATEWQLVITGCIIIAAVAFDEFKRRQV